MQSEDVLRTAAVACFTNAQELHEEAKLLFVQVQSPRSVALALIGHEEFAKAVVFTIAALVPEQRHCLSSKLSVHELKHQICDLANYVQIKHTKRWGSKAEEGTISDWFSDLATIGLDRLLNADAARKYYEELRQEHKEESRGWRHLQADPEQDIYLSLREPDLKNAALYVDLDASGKVLSPSNRVEEGATRGYILSLEHFLHVYAALPTIVGNDQRWRDFAEGIRNGLAAT
jgi:AbiV family abortive infection protein